MDLKKNTLALDIAICRCQIDLIDGNLESWAAETDDEYRLELITERKDIEAQLKEELTKQEKQKRLIKRGLRKANKALTTILDQGIIQRKSLYGINTQTAKLERANAILEKAFEA